jgi:hypothetical protein
VRWAAGFLAFSGALWAFADMSWRSFLVGALVLQLVVIVVGLTDSSSTETGRSKVTAVLTAAGIVWLAAEGGPTYLFPLLALVVPSLVIAAVLALRRRARSRRQRHAAGPTRSSGRAQSASPGGLGGKASSTRPREPVRSVDPSPPAAPGSRPSDSSSTGAAREDWASFDIFAPISGPSRRDIPAVEPAPRQPSIFGRGDLYFAIPAAGRDGPRADPELTTPRYEYFVLVDGSVPPPPAEVTVIAQPSGVVRVSGVARLCPPGTVEVRDSITVVGGDHTEVHLKEHVRIRRVEISLDDLMRVAAQAIADFREDGSVEKFQGRLRALLVRPQFGQRQVERTIQPRYEVEVRQCRYVHLGDGGSTDVDSRVVLERAVLPLGEMLINNRELCERFRNALLEEDPGRSTATFLRCALRVAGRTGDEELIESARTSDEKDARLHQLFGVAQVSAAALVIVGADNRLRHDTRLHSPGFDQATLRSKIVSLRSSQQAARHEYRLTAARERFLETETTEAPRWETTTDRDVPPDRGFTIGF